MSRIERSATEQAAFTIAEAAERLGVTEQRVKSLLSFSQRGAGGGAGLSSPRGRPDLVTRGSLVRYERVLAAGR